MLEYILVRYAGVAELADALDLGSSAARHGGSTPLVRTNEIKLVCPLTLLDFAVRYG